MLGILALLVTVVMYGSAGAGTSAADKSSVQLPESGQQTQTEEVQDQSASQEAAQGQPVNQEATQNAPYLVEIGEARTGTDYQGNPAVVIPYTFTNNSDEAISPMVALHEKVFQNGVQLDVAIGVSGADSGKAMSEVKPGASISYEMSYELQDTTNDVTVEVEELFSFSNQLLAEATFSF